MNRTSLRALAVLLLTPTVTLGVAVAVAQPAHASARSCAQSVTITVSSTQSATYRAPIIEGGSAVSTRTARRSATATATRSGWTCTAAARSAKTAATASAKASAVKAAKAAAAQAAQSDAKHKAAMKHVFNTAFADGLGDALLGTEADVACTMPDDEDRFAWCVFGYLAGYAAGTDEPSAP